MAPPIYLVALLLVFCFISKKAIAETGTATFYTEYTPSACDGNKNEGDMIAAASHSIWDNGAACGQKYSVSCIGATGDDDSNPCRGQDSVVVKIVDYCPSGCQGTIDLSQQAFAAIADPDAGIIKISFQQV